MIALRFSGHFQIRLATDPDPTDEPRGVSGYMRAFAGEPDFDRIIRFTTPLAHRSHAPPVGVRVTHVVVDGKCVANHPLFGAAVDLVGNPRFEGRNGIITREGEPIVPFTILLERGGLFVQRDSGLDVMPFEKLQALVKVTQSRAVIAAATGIWDFGAVLAKRLDQLKRDLANATNEVEHARLDARVDLLKATGGFLPLLFGVRMIYSFELIGATTVRGDRGAPSPGVDAAKPWPIEFWLGGWDGDAMTAFVDGWLTIPQLGDSRAPNAAQPADIIAVSLDVALPEPP